MTPAGLPDPPAPVRRPISLRDAATRAATEIVATESRADPDLLLTPWRIGRLTGKAGHLEAGAAGATFLGEAVLGLDGSPLAAIAAFAAGATLDAASADVEAATPPPPKTKRIKHTLR